MATTYAAYYNLVQADRAARLNESRRASSNSETSEVKPGKSGLKKFLNAFKVTEDDITPSGIYTPIIKQGPLFNGLKPAEKTQTPTPIYQRERPLFSLGGHSKKRGSEASVNSASS